MKIKTLFIIFATIAFAWSVWSGIFKVYFEKIGDSQRRIVLNFDKKSKGAVTIEHSLHAVSSRTGKVTNPLFVNFGGQTLIERCREEPVLFGGLFIFLGVSICGVVYVVHMVRTDSRLG